MRNYIILSCESKEFATFFVSKHMVCDEANHRFIRHIEAAKDALADMLTIQETDMSAGNVESGEAKTQYDALHAQIRSEIVYIGIAERDHSDLVPQKVTLVFYDSIACKAYERVLNASEYSILPAAEKSHVLAEVKHKLAESIVHNAWSKIMLENGEKDLQLAFEFEGSAVLDDDQRVQYKREIERQETALKFQKEI